MSRDVTQGVPTPYLPAVVQRSREYSQRERERERERERSSWPAPGKHAARTAGFADLEVIGQAACAAWDCGDDGDQFQGSSSSILLIKDWKHHAQKRTVEATWRLIEPSSPTSTRTNASTTSSTRDGWVRYEGRRIYNGDTMSWILLGYSPGLRDSNDGRSNDTSRMRLLIDVLFGTSAASLD